MKKIRIQVVRVLCLLCGGLMAGAFATLTAHAAPKLTVEEETKIVRVRPVLEGEDLESISESVYGTEDYADYIYALNMDLIGNNRDNLEVGMILELPEPSDGNGYLDWEYCYDMVLADAEDMEIADYISKDAGCTVTDYFFYYDGEGKGETFKVCYPQLTFDDGRDATDVNKAIEKLALYSTDRMLIHIDPDLKEWCETGEHYSSYEGIEDYVNYEIAYLDENLISVVFNDYFFWGSTFGEYVAMRPITINLNTGHVYTDQELWTDFDGLASDYRDAMIEYYKRDGSDIGVRMCDDIFTAEYLSQIMQTEGSCEGRYASDTFLTRYGVAISLTYRVNTDSYLTRGWIELEMPRKEIEAYRSDSELWELWKYKARKEDKFFHPAKQ